MFSVAKYCHVNSDTSSSSRVSVVNTVSVSFVSWQLRLLDSAEELRESAHQKTWISTEENSLYFTPWVAIRKCFNLTNRSINIDCRLGKERVNYAWSGCKSISWLMFHFFLIDFIGEGKQSSSKSLENQNLLHQTMIWPKCWFDINCTFPFRVPGFLWRWKTNRDSSGCLGRMWQKFSCCDEKIYWNEPSATTQGNNVNESCVNWFHLYMLPGISTTLGLDRKYSLQFCRRLDWLMSLIFDRIFYFDISFARTFSLLFSLCFHSSCMFASLNRDQDFCVHHRTDCEHLWITNILQRRFRLFMFSSLANYDAPCISPNEKISNCFFKLNGSKKACPFGLLWVHLVFSFKKGVFTLNLVVQCPFRSSSLFGVVSPQLCLPISRCSLSPAKNLFCLFVATVPNCKHPQRSAVKVSQDCIFSFLTRTEHPEAPFPVWFLFGVQLHIVLLSCRLFVHESRRGFDHRRFLHQSAGRHESWWAASHIRTHANTNTRTHTRTHTHTHTHTHTPMLCGSLKQRRRKTLWTSVVERPKCACSCTFGSASENHSAPGSVIQQLNINGDADTIELGVATPNQYVAFDAATRNLSLVRAVSREEVTTINMVITCKIRATQQTVSWHSREKCHVQCPCCTGLRFGFFLLPKCFFSLPLCMDGQQICPESCSNPTNNEKITRLNEYFPQNSTILGNLCARSNKMGTCATLAAGMKSDPCTKFAIHRV